MNYANKKTNLTEGREMKIFGQRKRAPELEIIIRVSCGNEGILFS